MTLEEAIKHAEKVMIENLEKTKGRSGYSLFKLIGTIQVRKNKGTAR